MFYIYIFSGSSLSIFIFISIFSIFISPHIHVSFFLTVPYRKSQRTLPCIHIPVLVLRSHHIFLSHTDITAYHLNSSLSFPSYHVIPHPIIPLRPLPSRHTLPYHNRAPLLFHLILLLSKDLLANKCTSTWEAHSLTISPFDLKSETAYSKNGLNPIFIIPYYSFTFCLSSCLFFFPSSSSSSSCPSFSPLNKIAPLRSTSFLKTPSFSSPNSSSSLFPKPHSQSQTFLGTVLAPSKKLPIYTSLPVSFITVSQLLPALLTANDNQPGSSFLPLPLLTTPLSLARSSSTRHNLPNHTLHSPPFLPPASLPNTRA